MLLNDKLLSDNGNVGLLSLEFNHLIIHLRLITLGLTFKLFVALVLFVCKFCFLTY